MAQLKDLLVTGPSRFIGDTFANNFEAFRITNDTIPIDNDTWSLGSSSLRWKNLYAQNLYADAQTLQELILQKQTSASNAYNASNPRITFKNVNGSQNAQLIFTDYDSVTSPTSQTLAPASLTLVGNESNVQFVTPRLRVGGYINNTYAFSTETAIVNSWIRTVGATGWLSESYGGGWYMNDTTWIRSYGDKSIYQNQGTLRTDGTFQIGDSGKYVNLSSSGFKFGDTAAASANNLMTLNGHMLINGSYNTTNSYSEGIRINRSTNGWCGITLGGTQGTTSGTGQGVWIVTTYSTPADATTAAGSLTASKFYISHNGSSGATTRIEGLWSSTASNPQGFAIYPRLGINSAPENSYELSVMGGSHLRGTVLTEGLLKMGTSTQSSAPADKGLYIHDLRNVDVIPSTFGANNLQFYFKSGEAATGRSTTWSSIMHLTGWTAGSYASHQISFNSDNTSQTAENYDGNLYHRSGVSAWGPWRTILDSHNMMEEIEIGGMNILPETQYLDNWSGSKAWQTDAPFPWCAVRYGTSPASGSSTSHMDLSRNSIFTPEPNTYYTLSFWAKASTNGVKIHSYFYNSITKEGYNSDGHITSATDGQIISTLSTSWKRYWITWKTNSSISNKANIIIARVMRDEHPGVTVYYALPKMEKGKMHSDWSPNPGDAVHIFGRSMMSNSSTAHYSYSGGGFHADNNSIVLHGNTTNGISGIVFLSEKGIATSINSPSDRAFIQYNPYGLTAAAEGTAPTLATSGEAGRLVIGIGDDAADQVWLQAPDSLGLKHQIGANSYTIADTNNVSWSAWTAGTSAGPKANISFAGVTKTSAEIPSASTTASGIVTNAAQSFAGLKTFEGGIAAGTTTANGIGIAQTNGTGLGLSLYGGHKTSTPEYGIVFAKTTNLGKFGDVQDDWATYFTMNIANQRGWIWKQYNTNSATGMAGSLSSRGTATFKALAAETGYLLYPEGGQYVTTSSSTKSGYLIIKTPAISKNTVINFKVRIYTDTGNLATYQISGYLSSSSGWSASYSRAYSEAPQDSSIGNLTVRFGSNGTVACITIGESNTSWSNPHVVVYDIQYGWSNANQTTYSQGWVIDWTTTALSSIASTITNPLGNKHGRFNNIVTFYREGTTANNYAAGMEFANQDTTQNKPATKGYIYYYNDHDAQDYGGHMSIGAYSSLFIGAGEGPLNTTTAIAGTNSNSNEHVYVLADGSIYLETNTGTIANRIGFQVNTSGAIVPVKAEAANNNAQNIGASDNKWANIYATTFNGALAGNASSASTVYSTAYVPSSRHYLEFQATPGASTSGNATLRHHDSLSVSSNVSTSNSGTQWTKLWIGNATSSGTAGNSQGWLGLYGSGTNYTQIAVNGTGNNNFFYIPNYSGDGYAVTAAGTSAVGGTTQPVYIAANGRATAITYTANRLYYSANTNSFAATGHYASSTKIGVNLTSEPSYNLYVSGTEYISSTATINGDFTANAKIKSTSNYNYITFDTIKKAGFSTNTTQTPEYSSKSGLIIGQKSEESSGIQFNGDYITMWSPCNSYSLVYFDEDNGNVLWTIDSSGVFSGKATALASTLGVDGGGTGLTSLTTNRIYYASASTTLTASGHYINNSKIGVNLTTEPSYNLYVSGTEYVSGNTTLNGTLTVNSTIHAKDKIVANAGNTIDSGARVELKTAGEIDLYSAGNPAINFHTENVTTANAKIIVEKDCIKFVFN